MFEISSKKEVLNRGTAPVAFLAIMLGVFKTLPDTFFMPDKELDAFGKAASVLGPYENLVHRKAVLFEIMRVLALFESSCDWEEGADVSKANPNTKENAEAGAWQASYDSRHLHPSLAGLLIEKKIFNGIQFQKVMMSDRPFAVKYAALLLSHNAAHNGPLYKGAERSFIRKSLQADKHSIYPWLSRDAVEEVRDYLA